METRTFKCVQESPTAKVGPISSSALPCLESPAFDLRTRSRSMGKEDDLHRLALEVLRAPVPKALMASSG
jgi:hypothetical protein